MQEETAKAPLTVWIAIFLTAVGLLVLMRHPPNLPASLKQLLSFDIPVPKVVERVVMWLIVDGRAGVVDSRPG